MSQLERTRVFRWTRIQTFVIGKWEGAQLSIERRSFERKLETIIRTVQAHHSNGLPAGAHEYKLLSDEGNTLCAQFSSRWKIDLERLNAQIPAIRNLSSLAGPLPKPTPAVMVSLGVVAGMALFFLLGVLAGLSSIGYHLIGGR